MRKFFIFILLLISIHLISEDELKSNWKLNLDIAVDPMIEDLNFSRGISLGLSRNLVQNLFLSLNSRFINEESSMLSILLNYDIIVGRFIIPFHLGSGMSLNEVGLEDLNFFYKGKSGIEFIVTENFNYSLSGVIIAPIFNNEEYQIYVDFGIKYRF